MEFPRIGRRRAVQAVLAVAAAVALLLWWVLPSDGPSYPKDRVDFATGVRNGVYDTYGKRLQPYLHTDLPGVPVRLVRSEGSVDNVRRVATGKAHFAIAAADAVADYDGPGAGRLRACARLYDDYMQLVVPADSPVRSAKDLRGLRVGIGQPSSGVSLIAQRLLEAADLGEPGDVRRRTVGIDRAPEMLRQGKLDAFFWSGGLPTKTIANLAETTNVKLVQLGDLVARLHAESDESAYYRQAVMPADAYPMVQGGRAVQTIAVANLLITTDRTDTGLVERLTRTVIDSRDRIGQEVHAAQLMDLRTAVFTDPLRLHAGAERYYQSVKP
ncbi:TAXI family TRAP transporter solute-binding subunit [Streptomyces sp. PA03-1a]|nr:TAXI family TRAP transporter solute-binding subunit [Streptomyces sp. PA03-1a]MDX2816891.1 TAXI family TRAP transporter solute-binding subunit [Streptomyces sp. PA03-5A]